MPEIHAVEPEPEDDELNLRELWSVIVKRRGTILLFTLIIVIAVLTATYLTTPIYRASLTLQIDREDIKVLKIEEVTPVETGGSGQDYYQTQYELLKSRSLAQRVVNQLGLADRPPENAPSLLARIKDGLAGWLPKAGSVDPAEPPSAAARLERRRQRFSGQPDGRAGAQLPAGQAALQRSRLSTSGHHSQHPVQELHQSQSGTAL
jgi:uncharacterized protein involved in exopolysaccharide biosynthesis